MQELNQLKEETGDIIIEITDTGIRQTK